MQVTIILNPYANRWKGLEQKGAIKDAFQAAGIDAKLLETESAGHGTELAQRAVTSGTDALFAAGGDGTINEILNGMMKSDGGATTPLGIIPIGTANDLVDNLNLPRDFNQIAQLAKTGTRTPFDLISVNDHYFANNAGLGLEPYVTTIQNRMTKLRGITRYLIATLKAIRENPRWNMEMEWDDGQYTGPVTLISIGNNPRTGGVFYTCPHANPFDGKLTFVFGYLKKRRSLMRALPMTFKAEEGNITEHPVVREIHSTWLKVKTSPASPAHADGELFTPSETNFHFKIHPGKLTLLT